MEKTPVIERLERVQYVTQGTLSYAATHPEYLRQVNSTQGIYIGNRVYQPQKAETTQNMQSYDIYIYENRQRITGRVIRKLSSSRTMAALGCRR